MLSGHRWKTGVCAFPSCLSRELSDLWLQPVFLLSPGAAVEVSDPRDLSVLLNHSALDDYDCGIEVSATIPHLPCVLVCCIMNSRNLARSRISCVGRYEKLNRFLVSLYSTDICRTRSFILVMDLYWLIRINGHIWYN